MAGDSAKRSCELRLQWQLGHSGTNQAMREKTWFGRARSGVVGFRRRECKRVCGWGRDG